MLIHDHGTLHGNGVHCVLKLAPDTVYIFFIIELKWHSIENVQFEQSQCKHLWHFVIGNSDGIFIFHTFLKCNFVENFAFFYLFQSDIKSMRYRKIHAKIAIWLHYTLSIPMFMIHGHIIWLSKMNEASIVMQSI